MIDAVKPDDNQRTRRPLSTPTDASCTHILVFPTSATAQANVAMNPQETHSEHDFPNVGELKLFADDDDIGDDIGGDISDLLGIYANVSPKMSGSPVHHADSDRHALGHGVGGRDQTTAELLGADTEEMSNHSLLQQPLAVGFFVSTAPTGPMPAWFWSSCPQRENLCPTCFRAALHIHCPFAQQRDELIHNSVHSSRMHPLDSNLTCDVLRYVLETYNALSWLTIDPATGDRRSCLPAHILLLMQLCRGFETFL
jgi:mediator of RNA polymerase II transcription subunit 13